MSGKVGSILQRKDGSWWARLRFTDPATGRKRDLNRRAKNKAEARDLRDQLVREYHRDNGRSFAHERKTFADLADYYQQRFAVKAEYVDGRKVGGLRSVESVLSRLAVLRDHFGRLRLSALTHGSLDSFRRERLTSKTRTGRQRSIASVNRELELLRRMLGIAEAEGWIVKNPFKMGERLISHADERQRERILSDEEELRLLAACSAKKRDRLRRVVICALDTGMRLGEILSLEWSDIDLSERRIRIKAMNTKTLRARTVGISPRLAEALEELCPEARQPDERVFGIRSNLKRSFTAARNEAGLPDLRFHDLRHTVATRLIRGDMAAAEVGRILGHTQLQTTYRYVNADDSTVERATEILAVVPRRVEVAASEQVN